MKIYQVAWDTWVHENITIWYGTYGIKMKILPYGMGHVVQKWKYYHVICDAWYKNENITIWYGTCGIKMKILPCDMGSMVYNWQYQMLWDIWYIIKSYENIYLNWKIICKNYLCFNILLSLLCSREKIWKLIVKIILLKFWFLYVNCEYLCLYVNLYIDIWYNISFILFMNTPTQMEPINQLHTTEPTKQQHAPEKQPELVVPNLQHNQSFHTLTINQPPIYSKATIHTDCISTYTLQTYTIYLGTAQSVPQKL